MASYSSSSSSSPLSPTSSPQPTISLSTSTTYSTPTLPPATTRALLTHLKSNTNTIPELAETLLDALSRTGWTDRLHALATELLRSGACTTYPELLAEVLRRARVPKPAAPESQSQMQVNGVGGKRINGAAAAKKTPATNGVNGAAGGSQTSGNGNGSISVREGWFDEDGLPDVRIPTQCVNAGVEFLKERIADVVEVVDEDEDSD